MSFNKFRCIIKSVQVGGQILPANQNIKHYHGIVKDDPNSVVALTFGEDEVMGLVATSEGNFNLALDKQSGYYIFYNDKNMKHRPVFTCSTETDDCSDDYSPENSTSNTTSSINSSDKIVRLYFETTRDLYEWRGNSVEATEEYVSALYTQVAALYRNEDITTALWEIFMWTTYPDPFDTIYIPDYDPTVNNTLPYLNKFRELRADFNGDLGYLLTYRQINGGRAAGMNLCNSNKSLRLAVSGVWEPTLAVVPNFSHNVNGVTHEFGHLLGSPHTHACRWNGNNTAIDGCAQPEGNCPRPAMPQDGGTIMSYCSSSV
ncbi:MAG: zinc-dependent metalloprotease, partial [Bacteroidales bacterium]|nr:zinc-dependent metalloprotease [Bacteroidales bacterium]